MKLLLLLLLLLLPPPPPPPLYAWCRLQATHYTGKWDCGMATEAHTPKGRGYDTSLFYFHHDNVREFLPADDACMRPGYVERSGTCT